MIKINDLHKLMTKHGYHYFQGQTKSDDKYIWIDFSTGACNGRGDWYEFKLGPTGNGIKFKYEDGETAEFDGLTDKELLDMIKEQKQ